jgi:hypothetical protein
MASTYYRGDLIWVRYKSPETGKWTDKSTGYRKSNPGDRRQAEKLRDTLTLRERTQQIAKPIGFDWVGPWIEGRWSGLTLRGYRIHWRHLERYLQEIGCRGPSTLTREQVLGYPKHRATKGAGANTSALELKLLGQALDEAIARKYCEHNPARNLRLKRTAPKEKRALTDTELAKVAAIFEPCASHQYECAGKTWTVSRLDWHHASYLLCRFQAARLMMARVPLDCIRLAERRIYFPAEIMKGRKPLTQPIDKRAIADLAEIVASRRAAGETTLASPPVLASLHWIRLLQSLGIQGASSHGFRVTWITQACLAGIQEAVAMRFVAHGSSSVHAIYLRLSAGDVEQALDKLH